jgi:hypothetical protein
VGLVIIFYCLRFETFLFVEKEEKEEALPDKFLFF